MIVSFLRTSICIERSGYMLERILDWWDELDLEKRKMLIGIALGVAFFILVVVSVFWIAYGITKDKSKQESEVTEFTESTEVLATEMETETVEIAPEVEAQEDPQSSVGGNMTNQQGASVDISQVLANIPGNETQEITLGIDVAKYQGTIDWKKVADSGVDFAMVRVGYRTLKTGEIIADANARYNMQEASKYGIKVGVYFFSTAISAEEAVAEANWVADYIAKYKITYPVVYNCEGYEDSENRQYSLTKTQRTDFAIAFLDKIAQRGYSPMFYASKGELEGDAKWETSRLSGKYKIWVAQYPGAPYPQTAQSSYTGTHAMWQYTNKGTVPGISKPVDMNVAYFGFSSTNNAQDTVAPEDVQANVEATMRFTDVNETVTAKERTNLRDKPSQGSDAKVVYTLINGETARRTGISDSGWSRVEFKGQTLYAVSSYLTTDLTVKQPEVPVESEAPTVSEEQSYEEANGIKTRFTEVSDRVTPVSSIDHLNLRAKPTTLDSVSPIVVEIKPGEVLERIGVSTDAEHTYSKIRYNGQILYCVSKYLEGVE